MSIIMIAKFQNIKLVNNFAIDFNKLALLDKSLREKVHILNNRIVWNFADQSSLIALSEAIMRHIFGYEWECPIGNLCPRVPSRLNYILWLALQIDEPVNKVLDIGTGATLVYPLIGWALYKWKFIATEICPESFQHSQSLIRRNSLQNMVDLRLVSKCSQESLLAGVVRYLEQITLVLCNPPFYETSQTTLSVMTQDEHHVLNGEYGFFFNLYRDSFNYKRIKYFSCLIGRLSSFTDVRRFLLKEEEEGFIAELKFGQIEQGNNRRFIVFWRIKH